jgi:type II secretion system protein J
MKMGFSRAAIGGVEPGAKQRVRAPRVIGFTLMEVLVATLASAILLAAVFGVFGQALRTREAATVRVREARLEARVLSVLREDLRQALVTGGRLASVLEGGVESRGSRFPGYLRLTTASGQLGTNAVGGDLQEVEYYLEEDPWSTNRSAGLLVRGVDRYLLAPVRQMTSTEALLDRVAALEVEFLDGNNWVRSWRYVDADSPLPVAVRVRVRRVAVGLRDRAPLPMEILMPWPTQAVSLSASGGTNSGGSSPPPGGGGGGGPPGAR